jgi:hypothetical protein
LADHLRIQGRREEDARHRAEALTWLERAAVDLPGDLHRSFHETPVMQRARDGHAPQR